MDPKLWYDAPNHCDVSESIMNCMLKQLEKLKRLRAFVSNLLIFEKQL